MGDKKEIITELVTVCQRIKRPNGANWFWKWLRIKLGGVHKLHWQDEVGRLGTGTANGMQIFFVKV